MQHGRAGHLRGAPELSPRTFWNFAREFLVIQSGKRLVRQSNADAGHGSAPDTRGDCAIQAVASRRTAHESLWPEGGPLSVIMRPCRFDGHLPQAADRLASTRARRAAAARDVRSAGTASHVPRYHRVRRSTPRGRLEASAGVTTSRVGEYRMSVRTARLPAADRSGQPRQLTYLGGQLHVDSWSQDGRTLSIHRHSAEGPSAMLMVPIDPNSSRSRSPTGISQQNPRTFPPTCGTSRIYRSSAVAAKSTSVRIPVLAAEFPFRSGVAASGCGSRAAVCFTAA